MKESKTFYTTSHFHQSLVKSQEFKGEAKFKDEIIYNINQAKISNTFYDT